MGILTQKARKRERQTAESGALSAPGPLPTQEPAHVSGALLAVLTAAVSALLTGETGGAQHGFVVRRVRRSAAWNRAGREEQISGRL